jgi:hypothetical protein
MIGFSIDTSLTLPSGLVRHHAADSLHAADGSLVSTLADLSGYGADLTASGGDRPVVVHDRLNGKPGIVFSGAQELASTEASGRPTTDITIVMVLSHMKRGSFPMFMSWSSGSTEGVQLFGSTGIDANDMPPVFGVKKSGAWGNNAAASTIIPGRGDPFILTARTTGATTKIRIDGANEVTDAGDSGSLDYGAGTITDKLGNRGSNSFPGQIVFFERWIFDRHLSDAEAAVVEAIADAKWRVRTGSFALFNGSTDGATYGIGLARGSRGWFCRDLANNPVIAVSGTGWKQSTVKDPWLMSGGICYYAGQNSSNKYQIGRATTTNHTSWTDDGGNPLLTLGSGGSFDDDGLSFPVVVYDPDDGDSTRRWKCWYAGLKASDKVRIGYAYSSDGISWTKHGQVVDVGTGGAWDDEGVMPGPVKKIAGVWTMLYWGRQGTTNPRWQCGVVTFTDPEGTYTKGGSNPTLQARFNTAGSTQALTAGAAAGTRTLTVADTSAFSAHEPIIVHEGTRELAEILSIDSGTVMTLMFGLSNSYTTSGVMRGAAYNSAVIRSARQLATGKWEAFATVFQPLTDLAGVLREGVVRVTADTFDGAWSYTGPLIFQLDDTGQWDSLSAENLSVI